MGLREGLQPSRTRLPRRTLEIVGGINNFRFVKGSRRAGYVWVRLTLEFRVDEAFCTSVPLIHALTCRFLAGIGCDVTF